jgi:O-antigen/teichoic acid export membrane protein
LRLARNLAAGIAHTVITTFVALAVVPLYIRFLGSEPYGLIGFNATLQAVLQILELGLAPAISREVARGLASNDMPRTRNVLRSAAWIYWLVAALIAFTFLLAAPIIAREWISAEHLSSETVAQAVLLMGVMIACRWPSGLYTGALIGAHRLTVSSALAVVYIVIANIGAVLVIAFWSRTIEAFFIWQAGCALVYTLATQEAAWRIVGGRAQAAFDPRALRSIWRFSVGMTGIALTGIIVSQLDKVILSALLPLADFGHYMLATAVAMALYGVISALFKVVFPHFSGRIAAGDEEGLRFEYRAISNLLAIVWFPGTMALILCAEPLLLLWTGSPEIAADTAPVLALLTAGTALHGMMYLPYALQLAYGMTRLPLTINLMLMAVQVPLIIFLALRFGAIGGAAAWLALHVLYFNLGTWMTHRRVLKGIGAKWMLRDAGVPLAISLASGLAGTALIAQVGAGLPVHLLIGCGAGLLAFLAAAALCPYKPAQIRAILAG